MGITGDRKSAVVVAGLGFGLALVARDLTLPLLVIAGFGLFDRLVGSPLTRMLPA